MASHAYLFIKGIEGSCSAEGHEKEIEVTRLNQNFSFNKENIKVGNINKSVAALLEPLQNNIEKAKLEEMSAQLITKFRDYKQSVRKGFQGAFKDEEFEDFNANLKLTSEHLNNIMQESDASLSNTKKQITSLAKEKLNAHLRDNYSKGLKLEHQTRLNNLEQILNKNQQYQQELKTQSTALSKFFEEEKKIEELLEKIKNSVAQRDPLEFTKYFDKSSPKLLEACCTGQIFDECRLMIYRSVYPTNSGKITLSAELLNNFVHVKFYNAYVTYYSISHSDEEKVPVETVKMNYDKVEFKFAQGDPGTGKKGQQKIISWDWKTNKAEEKGG